VMGPAPSMTWLTLLFMNPLPSPSCSSQAGEEIAFRGLRIDDGPR